MRALQRILELSLQRRRAVIFLAAALVAAGVWAVRTSNVDVFPEFAPPFVEIQTEAPGLSAVEVEILVSAPIERALAGVAGVTQQRSRSVPGLSSVILLFDADTDLALARQRVIERLPVAQMPAGVSAPIMLPPVSTLSRVRMIGVTSESLSLEELSLLARWVVRPRLLAVPGVANVSIWGERPRELQVLIDPARLASHGVGLDDVRRAAAEATARASSGEIETPNQRLTVTRREPRPALEALARAPVAWRGGATVRLGDVARVVDGSPLPAGAAVIDGHPGLLFVVEKQPDANTLIVTEALDEAFAELTPSLAGVVVEPHVFRPATFVEQAIANLEHAMALGVILVALVLLAFLADWRAAVISAVALPLSLLAAVLVLTACGVTLNVMILAGLVIAIGEVVDDAIVDVENIVRRLRENREIGRPLLAVIVDASLEVRSAIVYASLIVVLVFLPLFFLGGLAGAFFRPLGQAYVLAVLASLVVALTLTPVLAYFLLGRAAELRHEGRLARWLRGGYRPLLERVVHHPILATAVVALLLAGSGVVAASMGEAFFPEFEENDFLMHWIGAPSTGLAAMEDSASRVQGALRELPGVRGVGAHLGRAELADEIVATSFAEHWISLSPDVDHEEAVRALTELAGEYPGVFHNVMSYLNERIEEVLTGTSAPILIRIQGPELATLRATAEALAGRIGDVPGVAGVELEAQVLMPEVTVELGDDAAALGVTAGELDRALATLIRGERVGQVVEGDRLFDVVVRAEPALRGSPEALGALALSTPAGPVVPLSQLARVRVGATPNAVGRDDGARRIEVYVFTKPGADLGAAAEEIARRVRGQALPSGYSARILGEYQARQEALRGLLGWGALALLGIVVVLQADFRSWKTTALVVATLPFALVGGILAARASGDVLPLGALVGLVTVLGIAARNGIMLISHFRQLETEAGAPRATAALVLRGAEERLVPILMTALATALGLVPLVLAGVRPGAEIEHPLAVVVLGGLATSTLLNLLVLPALYLGAMGDRAR